MRLIHALLGTGVALTLCYGIAAHSAAADFLPKEERQGKVTYLSGGIGEEEARAMEAKTRAYPLTLEFLVKARPRAAFTSDVKVKIEDHAGKVVLETVTEGPFLLVRLPAGNYSVSADYEGERQARHIHLLDKHPKRVIFEWNSPATGADLATPHQG